MNLAVEGWLVLIALGAMLAVGLVSRGWLVPAFIALAWASVPQSLLGGLPSPVEVGAIVLLAVAARRAFAASDAREASGPVILVIALIGLAAIGTGLVAPEGQGLSLDAISALAFVFIVAMTVRGEEGTERTVVSLCALGTFLGLGAVYSVTVAPTALFPLNDEIVGAEAPRAAGPFGEANFFALSLAVLVPFAVLLAVRRRVLGYVALTALVAGVLATGSRGGMIAIVVGLLGTWLVLDARRWQGLAATCAVLVAMVPLFAHQIESSEERSVSGRATENLVAAAMFADHPLTGVGIGGYPIAYRDYTRDIGSDPRVLRAAHSLPLEIAAEQGLAGVLAWLAAGVVVIRFALTRGLWQIAIGRALLIALATYALGSLFLHGSQLRLLYVLVGLVFALGMAWPTLDRTGPPEARLP